MLGRSRSRDFSPTKMARKRTQSTPERKAKKKESQARYKRKIRSLASAPLPNLQPGARPVNYQFRTVPPPPATPQHASALPHALAAYQVGTRNRSASNSTINTTLSDLYQTRSQARSASNSPRNNSLSPAYHTRSRTQSATQSPIRNQGSVSEPAVIPSKYSFNHDINA